MTKDLKIKISIDKNTGKLKVVESEFDSLNNRVKRVSKNTNTFRSDLASLAKGAVGIYAINEAFKAVVKTGFEYNTQLEDAKAGLVALSVAIKDSSIPIMKRYASANREALSTLAELQKINADTPHTLNQTNQIYKAMYVSMKNAGASTKDLITLTKKISIAAGAGGIEFNSLLAGVDGLATGTVLANSDLGRFLSSLGLTNKALKESKNVTKLLEDKLSSFKAPDTMQRALSNLEVQWNSLTGEITKTTFKDTKKNINLLAGAMEELVHWTHEWNIQSASAIDIKYRASIDDTKLKIQQLKKEIKGLTTSSDLVDRAGRFFNGEVLNNAKLIKAKHDLANLEKSLLKKQTQAKKDAVTEVSSFKQQKSEAELKAEETKQKQLKKLKENLDTAGYNFWKENEAKKLKLTTETNNAKLKAHSDYIQIVGTEEEKFQDKLAQQMSALGESGILTAEELMTAFDKLNSDHEISLRVKGLDLIKSDIEKVNEQYLSIFDYIDGYFDDNQMAKFFKKWENSLDDINKKSKGYQGVGSKDWTAGLKGQAKDIANIGNAFGDLGDEQKKWAEYSKENSVNEADKNAHLQNQLGLYGNIAGAVVNMASEGSAAAKVAQVAQTALAVAQGVSAILNQGSGDPYTAIPRMIAMAAMVASTLSSIGASAASAVSSPYSASELSSAETIKLNDNAVVDRLDQQISLLEAIEKNGSAQALNVALAAAKFTKAKDSWVQDVFDMSRVGWVNASFENPERDKRNIQGYYKDKGLVNPYEINGNQIRINTEQFRNKPNDLIKVISDMSEMIKGEGFNYTGPFGQALAEKLGFSAEAHDAFLAKIKSSLTEVQGYLNDWAISVVDSTSELQSASDDMKDLYDKITGTSEYANAALQKAYDEFSSLLKNGQSYGDYLKENINNIAESTKYIHELSGVLDANGKNLTNYELLLSKDGDLIEQQMDKVSEFGRVTGEAFEGGAKDAIDYLDSIKLVSEAMVTSKENIKTWEDSFKTQDELVADMANAFKVSVATSDEQLNKLFQTLSGGLGGLTDSELEFLQANKDLIKSKIDLADTNIDLATSASVASNAIKEISNAAISLASNARGLSASAKSVNDKFTNAKIASIQTQIDILQNADNAAKASNELSISYHENNKKVAEDIISSTQDIISTINDELSTLSNTINTFQDASDSLNSMAKELKGYTGSQEELKNSMQGLETAISSGSADEIQKYLSGVQSSFTPNESSFSTSEQYGFSKARTASELDRLSELANEKIIGYKTKEEKLNASINANNSIIDANNAVIDANNAYIENNSSFVGNNTSKINDLNSQIDALRDSMKTVYDIIEETLGNGLKVEILDNDGVIEALRSGLLTVELGQNVDTTILEMKEFANSEYDWGVDNEDVLSLIDTAGNMRFDWDNNSIPDVFKNTNENGEVVISYDMDQDGLADLSYIFGANGQLVEILKDTGELYTQFETSVQNTVDEIANNLTYGMSETSVLASTLKDINLQYDWGVDNEDVLSLINSARSAQFDWNEDNVPDVFKNFNSDGSYTVYYDINKDGLTDLQLDFDKSNVLKNIDTNTRKTVTSLQQLSSIQQAYQNVLGRTADDSGSQYWQQQLDNGSVTQDTLQGAIAQSAIDYSGGDVAGVDIEASKRSAAEFLANQEHEKSIIQSFRNLVGREPSETDISTVSQYLNTYKEYTKGNIGENVLTLAVNNSYMTKEDAIKQIYKQALGKKADDEGLQFWMRTGLPIFRLIPEMEQAAYDLGSQFHHFADGGIVTSPTMGLIGEAGYDEAIIPLKDPNDPLNQNAVISRLASLENENKMLRKSMNKLVDISERQLSIQKGTFSETTKIYSEVSA